MPLNLFEVTHNFKNIIRDSNGEKTLAKLLGLNSSRTRGLMASIDMSGGSNAYFSSRGLKNSIVYEEGKSTGNSSKAMQ